MRKLLVILIIILISGNIFAGNLENKINNFFIKQEKNIELKHKDNKCKYTKEFYKKVIFKLIKIKKNPKYKKYSKILQKIILIGNNRYKNIKNCQITKVDKTKNQNIKKTYIKSENNTIHKTKENIKSENNNATNPILNLKFDKELLEKLLKNDYENKLITTSKKQKININKVNKIDKILEKYFVKIGNNWYMLNGYRYMNEDSKKHNQVINYIRKNYPSDYVLYLNKGIESTYYLIDKKNITNLSSFDLEKSLSENLKEYAYFDNFLYKKEQNGNIISGIAKKGNKLYYIVLGGKGNFYSIKDNIYIYPQIKKIKKFIIINNKGIIKIWTNGLKFYYIGDYDLYKNIDIKKLGEILYTSFFMIAKYNRDYSHKDMYKLLKFISQWDKKKLKDYYIWITKNIKYNENVNNILNQAGTTPENLDKKINSKPELIKNWVIFESFNNKEGVCQSLSDLFSLGALFNGQKASTKKGQIIDRGYGHQISQINGFYYDPTYDLYTKKKKYFGMEKKDVEKYFIFK